MVEEEMEGRRVAGVSSSLFTSEFAVTLFPFVVIRLAQEDQVLNCDDGRNRTFVLFSWIGDFRLFRVLRSRILLNKRFQNYSGLVRKDLSRDPSRHASL